MKSKYIILSILISIFYLPLNAATYTINETETISLTTGYLNSMNETWNVVSTVTNKPLIINYSIGTEANFDFVTIKSVDNLGNTTTLLRISGSKSGTISTVIPNGKVQITFTSDGSVSYANNSSMYWGINITFSIDNNSIQNENTYTSGSSIVNGRLGIGGAPTQSLTVRGGKVAIQDIGATVSDEGYAGSLMITKPAASGQYINLVRQGLMPWSIGTVYSSNTFAIGQGTSSDVSFSNPYFNITQSGYVGIGITSPAAGLHVTQANNSIAAILGNAPNHWTYFGGTTSGRIRGSNEGYLMIGSNPIGTGDKNLYLNFDSPGNIQMASGGGSVGIGTGGVGPIEKLDVRGNIYMNSGVDVNHLYWGGHQMIMGTKPGDYAHNYFMLKPGGSTQGPLNSIFTMYQANSLAETDIIQKVQINTAGDSYFNGGNVGIGTTTPDQALTVKGKIHANEIIIDVLAPIVPDFVFHPTYNLMPLHEVEQYVKTNSHLPEIPSAAEVSKNGMSIGEMQNKLLQKIEELTLYVIELQKTNELQSAKIEELEKKIK